MRFLAWVLAACLIATPAYAFDCRPIDTMLNHLLAVKHLGYFGDMIDQYNQVHMLFINPREHKYADVWITPDAKTACILFEGNWYFALEWHV